MSVFSLNRDLAGAPQYYSAAFSAFRRFVGADSVDAAVLTAETLDSFVTGLLREGKSVNTVRSYFRALKAVFNKDVKAGIVDRRHVFPASLHVLTDDEAAAAFAPAVRPAAEPRRYWYAVRNNSADDRREIADRLMSIDTEAATFLPDVRYRRLNRDGRPVEVEDRLLRNLVFVKAFPRGIAALQRAVGNSATVYFHKEGTDKCYSIISTVEMRNFIIAVRGGLDGVEHETADTRRFDRYRRVRVVGDTLFDGLEGVVERDGDADETHILIRLTGFNMVCWTKKIHRSQLRLLD